MNKKIKSLIIATLLVVGMSGNVFAAEEGELPAVSTSTISNPVFEDNKKVEELQGGLIVVEMTEKENEEYDIIVKWKEDKIKILGVKSYYENGSIDHTNYFEELYHCNTLEKEGEFVFGKVLGGGMGVDNPLGKLVKVEVTSEDLTKGDESVVPPEEEISPTVSFNDAEQKVINKYRESMEAVGVLNNGERQIDTSFMIEKQAWLDFIADVNEADNYVTIEEGEEKGEYHVYTDVSGEKKLIEVIFIDFFESDSKGWVPEITPGTGQAIAVGGIVVLTVAGVGLLVNNKKKKDEEK